jgi:putative transcriptional regulator
MARLETNLKKYRVSADMSQDKLAALVGVRRETIVHLEAGKYNPSLKLAFNIAKIFQVSIEEIFNYCD